VRSGIVSRGSRAVDNYLPIVLRPDGDGVHLHPAFRHLQAAVARDLDDEIRLTRALLASGESFSQGTWLHLRLDVIVNDNGDKNGQHYGLVNRALEPQAENGYFIIPDRPGLGVELNEAALKERDCLIVE